MYKFTFNNADGDAVVSIEREAPHPMSLEEERKIYADLRATYNIDPSLTPRSKSSSDPF